MRQTTQAGTLHPRLPWRLQSVQMVSGVRWLKRRTRTGSPIHDLMAQKTML